MDFEHLRTFLEVARRKSFSRAAEKLKLTQPAVSAQIRTLETEVGSRLFDREGGRVAFTAAGRVFEPFAEHCLECQTHILHTMGELERAPRGEISICANESTYLYVLPEVLAEFRQQYSRVALSIVRGDRARTLDAVINREVDFGVVSLPVRDARLTIELIQKDDLVLVVPAAHPLTAARHIKLENVTQYPLLVTKQGRRREMIDQLFLTQQLTPKIGMEVESSELLKRLIVAGLGIGFLPRRNAAGEIAAGTLNSVEVEGARLPRHLAVVFRKEKALTKAAQAFLEIATSRASQTAHRQRAK